MNAHSGFTRPLMVWQIYWLALLAGSIGAAERADIIRNADSDVAFASVGGLPVVLAGDVSLQWVVRDDPERQAQLRELNYTARVDQTDTGQRVTLESTQAFDGRRLTQRYVVRDDGVVELQLDVPPRAGVELVGAPSLVPEPLPGFGAMYGEVRPVRVDASGQQTLEAGDEPAASTTWFGIRTRFAAALLTGFDGEFIVTTQPENSPRVSLQPGDSTWQLRLYAGPVEHDRLRAVDPNLDGLLFAALWDWLRWLCFGMLWLMTTIDGAIGHIGWSIVLLSLTVKVLMLPLTWTADRLQASVNRTQALLQPKLDEIKRKYRGEDAHERTLAVYREQGVNPLYTLKSLAGFLIQIPVFIAAFDMLGENIALNGATMLWIDNLAAPDHWVALPFTVPFFGSSLNLLPCIMTGVTLLTSWLQTDPELTPELLAAQQRRLYLMAAAFFVLFYTFPAGMVLYWTTNNVVHLGKIAFAAAWDRRRVAP